MKKPSINIKLNKEQSTILLKLGLESSKEYAGKKTERSRSDVLLDILASKLPTDQVIMELLPDILKSLSGELESVSGSSLRDLLLDSKTQTALIRKIKDYGRELGASAKDNIDRDVALVIYFAAIAHGLANNDIKISEYSYEKLEQSFKTLSKHDWIPTSFSKFFQAAKRYCSKKTKLHDS